MRSNEAAFYWLMPVTGNAERRDYPIRGESPILSMTDVIWSTPFPVDSDHSHNCMEIGMCLAGGGTIRIGGQEAVAYAQGTVVIVPEGVRHSQQSAGEETSRWRYIAVSEELLLRHATPSCREMLARLIETARTGGLLLAGDDLAADVGWLISRMFDIKCRYSDEATAELEAMLLLILTRVAREPFPEKRLSDGNALKTQSVEPALLYIAEQYRSEIKIAQLARSCAMSESYFRKVFGQTLGVTPVEYLNRYRIERAVHMLRTQSGLSVSHVAEECGFTSLATFNRNFLRYTGQNPSELRRKNAQKRENEET